VAHIRLPLANVGIGVGIGLRIGVGISAAGPAGMIQSAQYSATPWAILLHRLAATAVKPSAFLRQMWENKLRTVPINIHFNSKQLRLLAIICALTCSLAAAAQIQTPPLSAAVLMNQVVANELADRVEQRKWIYMVSRREAGHTLTEEQIDTKDGPIYRLRAIDGTPLDYGQRQQDNLRIDRLLHDPSRQLKSKLEHEADEQKLQKLMHLLPQAFLFDYDGVEGDLLRIKFRPNPAYDPPTYETRVMHSLAGTILIDAAQKRMAKISGQLTDRVEFGYGLLGYIEKSGTLQVGRVPVAPSKWKTALINIQLSGRLIFFKTINKQEYEIRSNFRPVPGDPNLSEALQLLAP
jgi:hypothetical protein